MSGFTLETSPILEEHMTEELKAVVDRLTRATCRFPEHIDKDGNGLTRVFTADVCLLLGEIERFQKEASQGDGTAHVASATETEAQHSAGWRVECEAGELPQVRQTTERTWITWSPSVSAFGIDVPVALLREQAETIRAALSTTGATDCQADGGVS